MFEVHEQDTCHTHSFSFSLLHREYTLRFARVLITFSIHTMIIYTTIVSKQELLTLLAKLADSCLVNVCHRASQSPPAACAVDSHSEAAMRVQ